MFVLKGTMDMHRKQVITYTIIYHLLFVRVDYEISILGIA